MSHYIKWADAVARYPSLNTVGGAAEMESAWIDYVEKQVNGLLAPAFSIPLAVGVTVKDLCIELLYIRVGKLSIEETKDMREAFMERINRLVSGEESLIDDSGAVINSSGETIYSSTADYSPVFNLDDVLDWETDDTLLDDIANAKN